MTARETKTMPADPAIWQEVEFGGYHADLPAWEELAAEGDASVLELGAGAGRVSLHLAERGHEVLAVEGDEVLARALANRVADAGNSLKGRVRVIAADLERPESLVLPERPAVAIAPLHLIQIVPPASRPALLTRLAQLLRPGGLLALTLVDEETLASAEEAASAGEAKQVPEMRDLDGWVYSSEPLWVEVGDEALRIRRLRQTVDPEGNHDRFLHDELLHRLATEEVESEGVAAGFTLARRRGIPSGPNEADSFLLVLEAPQ